MTTEDFSQLTKIYGADIKRWPEEHHPLIADLVATQFTALRQILDEELTLDALLNQDDVAPASQALLESIMESSPQAKLAKDPTNFWQNSDWLNNIFKALGFTGIGLAGALTGMLAVSVTSSHLIIKNNELNVSEMVDFGQEWR
jgi:hypothetical protein